MTRLPIEEAHELIVAALVKSRTSEANAAAVARALIAAELAGQSGHGLRRVASYAAQAASGKVDGYAVPVAVEAMPAAVAIDAAGGFAYPALELATLRLAEIAPRLGIAIAGIRRSHHCGVAGVPVEAMAQRGLVALMLANSPPAMAPWGGNRALYGTNPIAFAAPLEGREPLVVDVSLSKVARGRIMAANQKGEPIPEGWAFDPDGAPTTDPKAALAGFMAPLGEAKGTALALTVELLAAGLTGANYAYEATSFFEAEGPPPGVGQTLIAIDPRALGRDDAVARFGEMARAVSATAGARLPGERRREIRERLLRDGIPVDDALLGELQALAA